ncbi:ileal sodium/bile acid cotransporter-like [Glandiceps talaboti]
MADTNSTNITGPQGPPKHLVIANQVIIIFVLVVMMIGMGATITLREVWENIKKPIGPVIGLCCQFLISPFLGWSLAMACDLEASVAIGALAIATCPGGTLSNVMTYLTDGDTCLSIVMTTFSTIFAMAFMPLWLFVYSRSWIEAAATLPYLDIIIALILILIPGVFGMLIRWKLPKYAAKIALVCSIITVLGIVSALVVICLMNPLMFKSSWKPYIVSFLLPTLAFAIGYAIPWALRQEHKKCRTIAFETGIQNTALALTVVNLTLLREDGLQGVKTGLIPALHGLISFIVGMSIAGVYLIYKKFFKKDVVGLEEESMEETKTNEKPSDITEGKQSNGIENEGFKEEIPAVKDVEVDAEAPTENKEVVSTEDSEVIQA